MRKETKKIEKLRLNNKKTNVTFCYEPFLNNNKLFLYIRNTNSLNEDKLEITNERFLEFLKELSSTYYFKYIHKDLLNIITYSVLSKEEVINYIKNICKKYGDSEYKVLKWFIGFYFLLLKDLEDDRLDYVKDIYSLQFNLLLKEKMEISEILEKVNLKYDPKDNTKFLNLFLWEKTFFEYEKELLQQEFKKEVTYDNNSTIKLGKTYIVNAIAGAGKTTWLKELCDSLIRKGISPYSILVLSFNKEIVEHDKKQLKLITGYTIETRTIHSFCYNIIETYSNIKINLLDEAQQRELIIKSLIDLNLITDEEDSYIDKVILALSNYNNLLDKNNYDEKYLEICKDEIEDINKRYDLYKTLLESMDYDDLMWEAKRILDSDSSIIEDIKAQYKIFCCDEFQDVNELQWDILKRFQGNNTNLYLVGDDDQSIYGFRGAKSQILVELHNSPNVITKKLDKSYRCPKQICLFAESVVENNNTRIPKKVLSAKVYNQQEDVILQDMSCKNFLEDVINYIIKNKDSFFNESKTNVILCRTNKEILNLKEKIIQIDSSILSYFDFKTIHKSKGLEYDRVLVLDWFTIAKSNLLQQNINSVPLAVIEEERRLFYVACTRAKENLYIFYRNSMESIFVEEGKKSLNLNLTKFQKDIINVFNDDKNKNIFNMGENLKKLGYHINDCKPKKIENELFNLYNMNINLNFSKIINEKYKYFVFAYLDEHNYKYKDNKPIFDYINNLYFVKNGPMRNITYFEINCFRKEYEEKYGN